MLDQIALGFLLGSISVIVMMTVAYSDTNIDDEKVTEELTEELEVSIEELVHETTEVDVEDHERVTDLQAQKEIEDAVLDYILSELDNEIVGDYEPQVKEIRIKPNRWVVIYTLPYSQD